MTNATCDADKKGGGDDDTCGLPAGWGTDHVGTGRCKLHGGASLRGEESPAFKHGLFSDYLGEQDRETMKILNEYESAEKLEELINWRLARLRRALRQLNQEEEQSFWDAFQSIVEKAGEIEADEISELAQLLDRNNRAMQEEIDLVRKLIKDHDRVAGDTTAGGEWVAMLQGGDDG